MAAVKKIGEPPRYPTQRDKYNWQAVADQARINRGTWVLAGTGILRGHAQQIRDGKKVAFRDEHGKVPFEVRTRGVGDRADLWVCYVGPEIEVEA